MYLNHWKLTTRPFENRVDPRFYYPGESQQGALLKLRYAIENHHGAAVLAGPSGLGKTLVTQTLLRQLEETYRPLARIVYPQMPADQLLAYVADELSGEPTAAGTSLRETVRRLESLLTENALAGRHAVVVIDEAHLLRDGESLQALRLLLNFESSGESPLTLLFTGNTTLIPLLEQVPEFEQRFSAKCLLRAFEPSETAAYLQFRLQVAGAKRPIFDDSAVKALHAHSHGVPRKLNRLADLALLVGYAEERLTLQSDQIEAVAEELLAAA